MAESASENSVSKEEGLLSSRNDATPRRSQACSALNRAVDGRHAFGLSRKLFAEK